jgi:zinc protease
MMHYVETYLASIPRGESWNTWTDLNVVRPGRVEETVYRGMEDQSRVFMAWFSPATFSEELSSVAQVLTEYLQIVMIEEIREKLGGVYSIGAGVSLSPVPRGELIMQVIFNCDPRRVRELSDAVIDLLRQTANSIDRETFNKAVEALIRGWEISMQSNAHIAQSYANSAVLLDLPLSRLHRRPHYFSAVRPEDIRRICAQLLQTGPAQVVLFPAQ